MDPHSRLNQFNQRGPKSGPLPTGRFSSDIMQKPSLETFSPASPSSASTSKKKPGSRFSTSTPTLLVRRPIATNSRIKQNESHRKDMYLAFVNNALEQKSNGNSQPFDELVNQFSPKRRTDSSSTDVSTSLKIWIIALTHVVSRLERTHSSLVEAIVNMPWTTLDSTTVKSYTVFIGMLLSARPEYLTLVLGKIAQGFTYQSGLQMLSQAFPESSASPITRRVIYDRLHYLLQHLLSLIPTLPSTLQPFLVRHFPHKRQNHLTQTIYIRNLLRMTSYCPQLLEKILATIVDRVVQIDVEIQIELEELDEEAPEEQPLFDIDPFDVVVGQEDSDSSDLSDIDDDDIGDDFSDLSSDAGGSLDEEISLEVPTNVKHIQDMVKKLDSILTLMFEYFKRTRANATSHSRHGSRESSGASRPPSPPEHPSLPPLPSLTSDSPLPSPINPTATPAYLDRVSRRTSVSEPPRTIPRTLVPSQIAVDTMRVQFNALLSIFDRTILRTFKSRYTQFLIFWYTSLDPEFADEFQGMLVERALLGTSTLTAQSFTGMFSEDDAQSADGSTITRAAAASYIGSFVSRAVFVDGQSARRVVAVLCGFLSAHLDEVEELMRTSSIAIGGTQHTVFYAVVQAVFLIFCFRWMDLIDFAEDRETVYPALNGTLNQGDSSSNEKTRKWMPELGVLQRVVSCVLNPLRICSFNVVMQFARVAHATDFIYCYTILESNKRLENAGASTSTYANPHSATTTSNSSTLAWNNSNGGMATAELNTFFPFDPYRLPRSAVFIKDIYREWSSVAIDDESDEEESDEEGEEETAYGLDVPSSSPQEQGEFLPIPRTKRHHHPRSQVGPRDGDDTTGGLGASLEQMSISPELT